MPKNNFSKENILFLKKLERGFIKKRIPAALSEAEGLVGHFGRFDRLDFLTGQKRLSSRVKQAVQKALRIRLSGMPLPYILKEAYFLGLGFYVTEDTLIPRLETELLVEEAVRMMRSLDSLRSLGTTARQPQVRALEILDVGTGCGCLAVGLTIQRPDCRMTALDISKKALHVARKNIRRHGLAPPFLKTKVQTSERAGLEKIRLVRSDLFSAFGPDKRNFWDIIISNPPYIPAEQMSDLPKEVLREPRVALDGGPKGLSVIERILKEAPFFLKEGGFLVMEIGKGQSELLRQRIEKDVRYTGLRFVKDFVGIERILIVQKAG